MRRNLSAQTPVIVNILTLDYLHKSMISKATCYIIRLFTLLATFTALTLPTFGLLHCYIIFLTRKSIVFHEKQEKIQSVLLDGGQRSYFISPIE